jgi:hypothetical protein
MLAILIPRLSFALALEDITDKSSDVYQDLTVTGSHFYMLGVLFQQPSKYLCQISQTNYQQFANFMATALATSVPYKADIKEEVCFSNDPKTLLTVEAKQASKDSPLDVTVWKDGRATSDGTAVYNVEVEAEVSATNPWGEVTYNVEVASSPPSKLLFKNYGKSKKLQDGTVSVQGAFLLESNLINQSILVGEERQWFSGDLSHREDDSGEGTIVFKNFNPDKYAGFGGVGDGSYPHGRPSIIMVADIAYNSEYVYFRKTIDYPFQAGNTGDGAGGYEQRCVSRETGWKYVDDYGVYDSSGKRNTDPTFFATYVDDAGDSFRLGVTNSTIETTADKVCRRWSDGSVKNGLVGGEGCSELLTKVNGAGFNTVELPDLSTITRDNGAEYLIRHLLYREVNGVVDESLCYTPKPDEREGLRISRPRIVPNHLFFSETALNHKPPSSGAVMVNAFVDGSSDKSFVEKAYTPLGDDDGDGVLNYLDAFPTSPDNSKDLDGDGIDDSEDDSDDRSTYSFSDGHSTDPTEYVSGSMAPSDGYN